jgi:pimeloyl-ACP methyl ester carboxylesterase
MASLLAIRWKNGAWMLTAALLVIGPAAAQSPNLATDSYRIPAADPGIELYLRNKHPAGVESFPGEKILLFVHGATDPAETAFDLPLGGHSMMEMIAERGWDVWLVDVRGYGGSTRPPEMDQPADQGKPFADTPTG